MPSWVSLNGTLMPAEEARVSVFDSGFMQGVGLFETMRAYGGRVFRLGRHIQRLVTSARALGWAALPDGAALEEHVRQVLSATGADARVRVTVTTGSLHAGASDAPELTMVISASTAERYPDEFYTRGVSVVPARYRQNAADPTTGHKTTSYFARLAALREAHAEGAFEALWRTTDDALAEGSISNVFIVKDEVLRTPPLATPVLPGVTRAAILELAAELGVAAREERLTLDDALDAEEVFITNSMIELLPVVRIGRKPVGNERVGEITRRLAVAYGELIDREDRA